MSAPKRKREMQLNFRLNQLTRRVHETGRIYDADLEDISRRQDALWDGVHRILTQLAKLS